jgi:hypothetical protein
MLTFVKNACVTRVRKPALYRAVPRNEKFSRWDKVCHIIPFLSFLSILSGLGERRFCHAPKASEPSTDSLVRPFDFARSTGLSALHSYALKWIVLSMLGILPLSGTEQPKSPFPVRGYYMTFMRMPLWGLPEWKDAVDCMREDEANTVILWMGGAFRSKKFPITWKYNEEHANVRADFARELIDYAHSKGIRVLLGFTPFGYDGVNQYPIEHPDLKAMKADGSPVDSFGIHCWGWSLCPSQTESQRFMLEYAREMIFDFYANADGIMIESSDYNVCRCKECGSKVYEKEFQFVRKISDEVWAGNPKAMIAVYPHYFSGNKVNQGSDIAAQAAKLPLDPRWTLCFNPHSAHLDAEMVRRAGSSMFWNDAPSLRTPQQVREGAQKTKEFGITGYVPSLEPFSYVMSREEFGSGGKGKRIKPLGFDWLPEGKMPLRELPARLQRLAYGEFSRNPELTDDEFRRKVAQHFFGKPDAKELTDDLLFLQSCINWQRDWAWASPLVDPEFYARKALNEKWRSANQAELKRRLERLRQIAAGDIREGAAGEMQKIARFIVDRWEGKTP